MLIGPILWVIIVLIIVLITGLIAGWAAGTIMKGSGYGVVMEIVLGVASALVGDSCSGFFESMRKA